MVDSVWWRAATPRIVQQENAVSATFVQCPVLPTANVRKDKRVAVAYVPSDVAVAETAAELQPVSISNVQTHVQQTEMLVDRTLCVRVSIMYRNARVQPDSRAILHPSKVAYGCQLTVRHRHSVRQVTCASEICAVCLARKRHLAPLANVATTACARRYAIQTTTVCRERYAVRPAFVCQDAEPMLTVLRSAFARVENVSA